MNVAIKKFHVEMDIKNKGVELEVRDTKGAHLGDLYVTNTRLIWCKGRTRRAQGKRLKWEKFIEEMESAA